tara:strand:- start:444 stop:722 length:279 start_codon:yes stop_codon:yes gene_type:complete
LTQDIDRELSKIKRGMIERENKMFMIAQYKFKSDRWVRKCKWTSTFPVDQLVDEHNMPLKFKTKQEAYDTLEEWGVDINFAEQQGVKVVSLQ